MLVCKQGLSYESGRSQLYSCGNDAQNNVIVPGIWFLVCSCAKRNTVPSVQEWRSFSDTSSAQPKFLVWSFLKRFVDNRIYQEIFCCYVSCNFFVVFTKAGQRALFTFCRMNLTSSHPLSLKQLAVLLVCLCLGLCGPFLSGTSARMMSEYICLKHAKYCAPLSFLNSVT